MDGRKCGNDMRYGLLGKFGLGSCSGVSFSSVSKDFFEHTKFKQSKKTIGEDV